MAAGHIGAARRMPSPSEDEVMFQRSGSRLPITFAAALLLATILGLAAGRPWAAGEAVVFAASKAAVVTAKGRFDFSVEMALNPAQHSRGLQGRSYMAPSAGMLFDFGPPQPVTMWMKDTLISLDMLFIDAGGVIVNLAEATTPHSLANISSGEPVRAVMELNAGTARRIGVKIGDRVIHEMFAAR